MNGSQRPPPGPGAAAFDARLRGLHAEAVGALTPRTRARLAPGRRAIPPTRIRHPRRLWPWATALGSACVLVLALHLQPPPAEAPAPPAAAAVAAAPPDPAAILAQSPDFYVWLASTDVLATTTE